MENLYLVYSEMVDTKRPIIIIDDNDFDRFLDEEVSKFVSKIDNDSQIKRLVYDQLVDHFEEFGRIECGSYCIEASQDTPIRKKKYSVTIDELYDKFKQTYNFITQ